MAERDTRADVPIGSLPFGRVESLGVEHPQRLLDLAPAPRQSLDNFVVGDNAELVAQLASERTRQTGDRFLYLWGGASSGRTHLLRAAIEGGAGRAPFTGRYMDLAAPDGPLGIELLAEVGGRPLSCLALDNVDSLDAGGEQQLFNLYNTVRAERPDCLMMVAGPRPPAALALRADLITRLSWGLTYEVHMLTDVHKAAALAAHAQVRGLALGAEVIDWLLQTLPRDMRTLLAVVEALDRYSLATKRAITLPLAREWLRGVG